MTSLPPAPSVEVIQTRYAPGFRSDWHDAPRAQLIYPGQGVMTLEVGGGAWVVPPLRGCWLRAGEPHRVTTRTGLQMHSVYWQAPTPTLPERTGIVAVSALMRELIVAIERDDDAPAVLATMRRLLGQLVVVCPQTPLFMPTVRSPMLRRIQEALARDPSDGRRLDAWADLLGTTTRTLARGFARETGMRFTEFRRQTRLHAALELLASGKPVTSVAYDVGFHSAASFIAAFRKALGTTPARYFEP